jgi:glucuronate isomerase
MATKVERTTICDLTGEPADETLDFGLAGKAYTIDLTKHHADGLREILADYIKVAQPAGKLATASSNGGKARAARPGSNREQLSAVREWGRNNGFDVNDRGRISAALQQAFDAAHAPQQAAPAWA